jgi:hypothetical protein
VLSSYSKLSWHNPRFESQSVNNSALRRLGRNCPK